MECNINYLPEDLIAHALSLTAPLDACKFAATSSTFRSAAESDTVWERFLPSDYRDVLQRSVSPVVFSSKKELYFQLSDTPILVDGSRKMFSLERSSGKKRFCISARELSITWADNPMYWTWKSMSQSRFEEVVELRMISWLEIHGKINTQLLSPDTTYGAYLIMNISNRAYGLDTEPSEVSVEVSGNDNMKPRGIAYLRRGGAKTSESWKQMWCWHRTEMMESIRRALNGGDFGEEREVREREDGWMEIELGEFYVDGVVGREVKMSLVESKGVHLKGGLVIEGIEVRPKL
ncbi:hypothetical protein Syun_007965 [Stephania yunnanensis]|uniref:F-box domain-containing protein n=1 Tax=Stephania yunnanensis TaxID=152371 RepID=A0AAP0L381_9MAGN